MTSANPDNWLDQQTTRLNDQSKATLLAPFQPRGAATVARRNFVIESGLSSFRTDSAQHFCVAFSLSVYPSVPVTFLLSCPEQKSVITRPELSHKYCTNSTFTTLGALRTVQYLLVLHKVLHLNQPTHLRYCISLHTIKKYDTDVLIKGHI